MEKHKQVKAKSLKIPDIGTISTKEIKASTDVPEVIRILRQISLSEASPTGQ